MNPGARVNHYLLTKPLGKGGQGSVWEAFPVEGSNAPRALKLIDLRGVEKDKAERAWREAQALHDVIHPGLVPCREFFRDSDTGLMGLVFDLVPGQTLSVAARDSRMTTDCKFAILEQLAAILAYVHHIGIVHRDLKPANVLIADAFYSAPRTPGGVKLVDFGISVRAGNPTPVTNPGSFVGTIPYLPPDLVCPGQWPLDREGFARDVFAFGVMGWELIHGKHPTGLSPETLLPVYADAYREAQQQRRAWPPQSSNEPWMIALRACLMLDPQRRPANGTAILDIVRTGHFAPEISTELHQRPTAVHTPPGAPPMAAAGQTPLQSTPEMRGVRAASAPAYPTVTTPNQGGYPQRTPAHPARDSAQNANGSMRWIGFVIAAAFGALVLWLVAFPKNDGTSANTTIPLPTNNGLPVQRQDGPKSDGVDVLPCCHGQQACPSERICTPQPCTDLPLPARAWTLRAAGVVDVTRNEDVSTKHPKASLCMRNDRTGDKACAPITSIARTGGDRANVLHAMTSDLTDGRITLSLIEGTTTLYPETRIADNRGGIATSVLCRGLRLRMGPRDTAPVHAIVYLD